LAVLIENPDHPKYLNVAGEGMTSHSVLKLEIAPRGGRSDGNQKTKFFKLGIDIYRLDFPCCFGVK
jgi:hypothetical protein